MRRAILVLSLTLIGCASGPPEIRLDARGFIVAYMWDRDQFIRQTAAAHRKCEATKGIAAEVLKAKCERLAEQERIWQARDGVILQAILTRQTIDGETLASIGLTAAKMLALAADILL